MVKHHFTVITLAQVWRFFSLIAVAIHVILAAPAHAVEAVVPDGDEEVSQPPSENVSAIIVDLENGLTAKHNFNLDRREAFLLNSLSLTPSEKFSLQQAAVCLANWVPSRSKFYLKAANLIGSEEQMEIIFLRMGEKERKNARNVAKLYGHFVIQSHPKLLAEMKSIQPQQFEEWVKEAQLTEDQRKMFQYLAERSLERLGKVAGEKTIGRLKPEMIKVAALFEDENEKMVKFVPANPETDEEPLNLPVRAKGKVSQVISEPDELSRARLVLSETKAR